MFRGGTWGSWVRMAAVIIECPSLRPMWFTWLERNFGTFIERLDIDRSFASGAIVCDGDKCGSFKYQWEEANIPFEKGVAMYLITKMSPYIDEVRDTKNGWVDPGTWVVDNYWRFEHLMRDLV